MNKIVSTQNWENIYHSMDALSDADRDEISLKTTLIGEVISACEFSDARSSAIALIEESDPSLTTILKILRPLGKTLAVVPLIETSSPGQRSSL